MEKIVVAKKYRLLEQKNGSFIVNDFKKEIRSKIVVEKSFIDTENKISGTTGLYYEIDQEATKVRYEKLNPKKKAGRPKKED